MTFSLPMHDILFNRYSYASICSIWKCDITSPIFSQTLPPVNYMLQVFYNYLDMRDFDTSSNIQNTCIRNLSAFLLETINLMLNISWYWIQYLVIPHQSAVNRSNLKYDALHFHSRVRNKLIISNLENISTLFW